MPLEHDPDNQHIELSIEDDNLVLRIWSREDALGKRVILGGVEYNHLRQAVEFLEEIYA
jgi:hypothetical protein